MDLTYNVQDTLWEMYAKTYNLDLETIHKLIEPMLGRVIADRSRPQCKRTTHKNTTKSLNLCAVVINFLQSFISII